VPIGNLMMHSFSAWKYFYLMENKVHWPMRCDPMTQEKNCQE